MHIPTLSFSQGSSTMFPLSNIHHLLGGTRIGPTRWVMYIAWLPRLIWRRCSTLYHPSSAPASQHAVRANTDGLCPEAHGSQWRVGILQLPWKSWVLWFLYRRSISDPRRLQPRIVGHTHRPLSRAVAHLFLIFAQPISDVHGCRCGRVRWRVHSWRPMPDRQESAG